MSLKKSILKYITGNKSAEEKIALEGWKQEAEENLTALKELLVLEQNSSIIKDYKEVDHVKAWKNIEAKTGQSLPNHQITKYIKIAAIFVFVIAALFTFRTITADNTNNLVFKGDQVKNVNLEDGSEILLETQSVITQTAFRNINLQGKAYFDIAKNPEIPFVIVLNHGLVTVLGTAFNINTSPQKTSIVVTEGKVKINYNNKEYTLSAGDGITINDKNIVVQNKHILTSEDWRNKVLRFDNQSLYNVMVSVAYFYNLELDWIPAALEDNCKINTSFKNETVEQVLKELKLLAGIQYEITATKIILKSFKC